MSMASTVYSFTFNTTQMTHHPPPSKNIDVSTCAAHLQELHEADKE